MFEHCDADVKNRNMNKDHSTATPKGIAQIYISLVLNLYTMVFNFLTKSQPKENKPTNHHSKKCNTSSKADQPSPCMRIEETTSAKTTLTTCTSCHNQVKINKTPGRSFKDHQKKEWSKSSSMRSVNIS